MITDFEQISSVDSAVCKAKLQDVSKESLVKAYMAAFIAGITPVKVIGRIPITAIEEEQGKILEAING